MGLGGSNLIYGEAMRDSPCSFVAVVARFPPSLPRHSLLPTNVHGDQFWLELQWGLPLCVRATANANVMSLAPFVQERPTTLEHSCIWRVVVGADFTSVSCPKPTWADSEPFCSFLLHQFQCGNGCQFELVFHLSFGSHFSCFASGFACGLYLGPLRWLHVAR